MGLGDIFDFFEVIGDSLKELGEDLAESGKEFHELMTDGVVQMLVLGNEDYKTSYEKDELARSIVRKSKKEYNAAADNIKERLETLHERMTAVYERKSAILESLQLKAGEKPEKITIKATKSDSPLICIESDVPVVLKLLPGVVFLELEKHERIERADYNLENAKDYRIEVEAELAKLKQLGSKIQVINRQLTEVEKVLDALEQLKTREMSAETIDRTVALLKELLVKQFLDDEGRIQQGYKKSFEELKNLVTG